MFGDDIEQYLTEAYGDDEQAKAAARADMSAMLDHRTADATDAHALIARQIWKTLRGLGISEGRMLVLGPDPEVFAGLPPSEQRMEPGDSAGFTAQIPPGRDPDATWPHSGTVLRVLDDDTFHDEYDAVIAVAPYVDVAMHRRSSGDLRQLTQTTGVVSALENTEPGGFVIAMVSQELLDAPDPGFREYIAGLGELVGAVRLPAGALRPEPGNDGRVDLLVLRRHFGQPVKPHTFLRSLVHEDNELRAHLNEYYLAHRKQLLGLQTIQATTWGPPELTVLPSGKNLEHDLAAGLTAVVTHARQAGLTADTSASPRSAYEINLDAPIDYIPVDLPDNVQGVDLDVARDRVNRLRAQRQTPSPDHDESGPTRPGRTGGESPRTVAVTQFLAPGLGRHQRGRQDDPERSSR